METVSKSSTVKFVAGTEPPDVMVTSTAASLDAVGPLVEVRPRISAAAVGSKLVPLTLTTVPGRPEVGDTVTVRLPKI